MRIRLPELLKEHRMTAYALSKRSGGRLSMAIAYRMAQDSGTFRCLTPVQLTALCEVFGVEPTALFTREPPPKKPRTKR